ncbi:unnamed protein product [Trichogramma brassicae]|uniref:Uncharacterized protein n=1 Tax=Trichogramma brassicae TaxID=86971 RepID=A0A6H5ITZ2_9HYME|nr:unnamed protein product [Trichogramma brassicae]
MMSCSRDHRGLCFGAYSIPSKSQIHFGTRRRYEICDRINFLPLTTGLVAQRITRLTTDQKIPGSNPGKPSIVVLYKSRQCRCSLVFSTCQPRDLTQPSLNVRHYVLDSYIANVGANREALAPMVAEASSRAVRATVVTFTHLCLSNPTMELPMETTRTMSVLADTTAVDPSVTTTPAAATLTTTTTTTATITTTTTSNDTTSTGDPTSDGNSTTSISPTDDALARLQQSYRINKATGLQNVSGDNATGSEKSETSSNSSTSSTSTEQPMQADATTSIYLDRFRPIEINTNRTVIIPASAENNRTVQEPSRISNVNTKKENKISWISVLNPPARPNREENSSDAAESISPSTTSSSHEILTVMPLQVNTDYSIVEHNNNNNNNVRRNRTAEQLLGDPQNTGELQAVATAASVFEAGYGDSTRLGRARGAFTSEFQREQVASSREDSAKELIEPVSVSKNTVSSGRNITEIATITGSCLAVIVLLSSVGSVSFIMYRQENLNY